MLLGALSYFLMDEIIAACLNYESTDGYDFPTSGDEVNILGKTFIPSNDHENLRTDIRSRIWLTYRKGFEEIEDTGITSDKGWGCMIRCGQMIFAESLLRGCLGRDWSWKEDEVNNIYIKIVSLFEDTTSKPYSIHNLSKIGVDMGKNIGEWHGPNTIAQSIKKVKKEEWMDININVVMDNIFIVDEIKTSDTYGKPLLIFLQVRLGITEINSIYIKSLFKCLAMPQSVGIIGGTPNHALYFIGFTGQNLIYLDPHTTQQVGSIGKLTTEEEREQDATYHCDMWNEMPVQQIDPSMAICFFCKNEKDFDDLCNRLKQDVTEGDASFFTIYQTRPNYLRPTFSLDIDLPESDSDNDQSGDDEFEVLK